MGVSDLSNVGEHGALGPGLLFHSMPSAIIIGGLYATARHLVQYLVENALADPIRVVDKSIPQLAFLSPLHELAFQQVEFIQCSMVTPGTPLHNQLTWIELAHQAMHKDGIVWDYIFCFTLEGKLGQPKEMYELAKQRPALHAAEYALLHNSIFVYQSIAAVHVPIRYNELANEDTPYVLPKNGHLMAYTLKTEEQLRAIDQLKLIVLREAGPFGPDAPFGYMPLFVMGRVFKETGRPMHHFMEPHRRLTSVHIKDVARAYWHVAKVYPTLGKSVCVYNLACDVITEGWLMEAVTSYYSVPLKSWNPVLAMLSTLVMVHLPLFFNWL
jgi:nucleoside-diphosphate-sugar epimerase